MSTTFCLSVRTECASDDNTTRTDFSHYFRSLAEVVLNTLHLTYKQASKSITTHGWWAEVGLAIATRGDPNPPAGTAFAGQPAALTLARRQAGFSRRFVAVNDDSATNWETVPIVFTLEMPLPGNQPPGIDVKDC